MKGLRKPMKISISSDDEKGDPFMQSMQVNKEGEIKFINDQLLISKEGISINEDKELQQMPTEDLVLGELLGRGTAGTVMKGVHLPTGREVAVKSINIYDKEKRQ